MLLKVRTDDEVVGRARTASIASTINDAAGPQVAEVDSKQEWGIHDIIGKKDDDGVVHYLVEWSATLVPKHELGKAKGWWKSLRPGFERKQGREMGEEDRRKGEVDIGSRRKVDHHQNTILV
jgi:hypothetical protein